MRVIVAGGDGTVMWAMSEVILHGIDVSRVAFGVVPFGTGNDFARSLGWGKLSKYALVDLCRDWLEAPISAFDLWKIAVHVNESTGEIHQIKNKVKITLHAGETVTRHLERPMCNYFSIGIESRIGLGFDRNRKRSAFMNKLVYGWEGLKKSFMRTPRVMDVMESLSAGDQTFENFKGSPVSLIFTNIASFAGGCDIWGRSHKKATPNETLCLDSQRGDGQLEVLTYNSLAGLSSEQIPGFRGNGRRVCQHKGPFEIKFRPDIANKRTYMQIDGEFYTMDNPISVNIQHTHTIKVLVKKGWKK